MIKSALGILLVAGFVLTLSTACSEDPPWDSFEGLTTDTDADTDADSDVDSDTDTDVDTDTDTDTGTGTGPDPTCPALDCDDLPDAPILVKDLIAPAGYHDVAFDGDGHIVGMDGAWNGSLLKVTYDNQITPFVPGLGSAQGFDYLPSGDLILAKSDDGIYRIDESGTETFLNNDPQAYGVTIGPDGMAYICSGPEFSASSIGEVYRLNPSTGVKEVLLSGSDVAGWTPRVANFSPDHSKMYIASLTGLSSDGPGNVYVVDLDSTLTPTGSPTIFASGVGTGWHDGLGVDECGNLYVPEYNTHNLYRISPEGDVEVYIDWDAEYGSGTYGHGLEWGSGIDGWKADAIYLPQPYDSDTVVEVMICAGSALAN